MMVMERVKYSGPGWLSPSDRFFPAEDTNTFAIELAAQEYPGEIGNDSLLLSHGWRRVGRDGYLIDAPGNQWW